MNTREMEGQGWLLFSGLVLMVMGVSRLFDAIWAFRVKASVPSQLKDGLFGQTFSTYGWVWLIMAVLLFLAGLGVIARNQYARWFGIAVSAIAGIAAMAWMPYYPVWTLLYMGGAFLVLYGLSVHGGREGATV